MTNTTEDQFELIWARDLREGDLVRGLNNATILVNEVTRSLLWDGPVDLAPVIVEFDQCGSWCYQASETVSIVRRGNDVAAAIADDDALLDRLGSAVPGVDPIGTPSVPMTELDAVLISHRLVVEADPIPDLVDTDTAIATIKAGAL